MYRFKIIDNDAEVPVNYKEKVLLLNFLHYKEKVLLLNPLNYKEKVLLLNFLNFSFN